MTVEWRTIALDAQAAAKALQKEVDKQSAEIERLKEEITHLEVHVVGVASIHSIQAAESMRERCVAVIQSEIDPLKHSIKRARAAPITVERLRKRLENLERYQRIIHALPLEAINEPEGGGDDEVDLTKAK